MTGAGGDVIPSSDAKVVPSPDVWPVVGDLPSPGVDLLQLARDPIVALIIACEFGLWIMLGLGLVARYLRCWAG